MLELNNISTGYGNKQVLYNVFMTVEAGEVLLLTGGNGSGKSTLLQCIYNLLPKWSGITYYKGTDISSTKSSDLIHKGILYIPQKDYYFENLTLEENLKISGHILPKKELNSRIHEILELTGLTNLKKRKPFNLSGGERKVLAFAMALIHRPSLLLFDEPFAGVDPTNSALLLKLFNEVFIKSENGLIIVEHKDDDKQIFTRKVRMELGNIINTKS